MDDHSDQLSAHSLPAADGRRLGQRVQAILATKGLSLYALAALSRDRHPNNPAYHLPHNFYFQLASGRWTPRLHQLAALAELSGYRLTDWLELFAFRRDAITWAQSALPRPRTTLLDGTVHNPQTHVQWFRDRLPYERLPPVAPLTQLLMDAGELSVSLVPVPKDSSRFLYAKIGTQDALAFPDLAAGSIIRANPAFTTDDLQQAVNERAKQLFLVEHSRGVCCSRLHFSRDNKITIVPSQLPFAHVELELGSQARILGLLDFELRSLAPAKSASHPLFALPEVAPELLRQWTPGLLDKSPTTRGPAHLLRQARVRAGFSLRTASTLSRNVAEAFGDDRHFISPGSLSDYEASDRPPRHIEKIFTLAILYSLDLSELFRSYGVDLNASADPITGGETARQQEGETANPEGPVRGLLSETLEQLGELPFFLFHSLSRLAGIPELSLHDAFWVGGQVKALHPVLTGARIVVLNRRRTTPPGYLRKSLWDCPLYLALRRDGSYLTAAATLEDNTIVVHPHTDDFVRHERLRNHADAEVLGQIVCVIRSLGSLTDT
jgi:transcriptional regulator with XRE-family HTH domain